MQLPNLWLILERGLSMLTTGVSYSFFFLIIPTRTFEVGSSHSSLIDNSWRAYYQSWERWSHRTNDYWENIYAWGPGGWCKHSSFVHWVDVVITTIYTTGPWSDSSWGKRIWIHRRPQPFGLNVATTIPISIATLINHQNWQTLICSCFWKVFNRILSCPFHIDCIKSIFCTRSVFQKCLPMLSFKLRFLLYSIPIFFLASSSQRYFMGVHLLYCLY